MSFISKKINLLGVAALIIGGTAAFTTSKDTPQTVTYGYMNGSWVLADANDRCEGVSNICKREYPEGHDPNIDESGYLSQENGTFIAVP